MINQSYQLVFAKLVFSLLTKLPLQLAFTCSKIAAETVEQDITCPKLTVIEQRQLMLFQRLFRDFGTNSAHYARVFTVDFEHVFAGLVCTVCETQNFLTLQYTVYSKIPFSRNSYHTETNHLQCIANQLNGFNRHQKFNLERAELF